MSAFAAFSAKRLGGNNYNSAPASCSAPHAGARSSIHASHARKTDDSGVHRTRKRFERQHCRHWHHSIQLCYSRKFWPRRLAARAKPRAYFSGWRWPPFGTINAAMIAAAIHISPHIGGRDQHCFPCSQAFPLAKRPLLRSRSQNRGFSPPDGNDRAAGRSRYRVCSIRCACTRSRAIWPGDRAWCATFLANQLHQIVARHVEARGSSARHCGPTRQSRWSRPPAGLLRGPSSAQATAADRPVKPPPIMQMSAHSSPVNGHRMAAFSRPRRSPDSSCRSTDRASYPQQQMLAFPAAHHRLVVEQLIILHRVENLEEILAQAGCAPGGMR